MEINCRIHWTILGSACLCFNLLAVPASTSNSSSSATKTSDTEQNTVASGLAYAGPQLSEDTTGLSIGADYILWQIAQEGLEVVESNYYPAALLTTSPSQGSAGYPRFKYLSGFKFHGRVTLEDSENIDLFLQYIWLQRSNGTNSGTGGPFTYPAYDSRRDSVTHWSSSFKSSYNVIDFEMGRLSSFAKDTLSIRNLHNWNSVAFGSWITGTSTDFPATVTSYQNTSGAGVRSGTNLAWQLFANKKYFSGFKLLGMSALSGVYGRTYVDTQSFINVNGTVRYTYDNRASFNRIIPVVDLSIGLSWERTFAGERDNDYNIEIHAFWDTQSWIGYGRYSTGSPDPTTPQNLTVQGFTIGTQITF